MSKHKCLSCDCLIEDKDDEEQVAGLTSPVRYRHKTPEGCGKAMQTHRTTERGRIRRARRHRTLSEYDSETDKNWFLPAAPLA